MANRRCDNCVFLEADGEIINKHIEKHIAYDKRIEQLEAENHKLKLTMQLHAGDCCSLNNEVELFRDHWMDAEERLEELELQLKEKDKLLFAYESVHTSVKEDTNGQ